MTGIYVTATDGGQVGRIPSDGVDCQGQLGSCIKGYRPSDSRMHDLEVSRSASFNIHACVPTGSER